MKPQRIWTKKYEDGSKEWIEYAPPWYVWKSEENGICAGFPICYYTIREKFQEQGREFIPAPDSIDAEVRVEEILERGEFASVFI